MTQEGRKSSGLGFVVFGFGGVFWCFFFIYMLSGRNSFPRNSGDAELEKILLSVHSSGKNTTEGTS